MRTSAAIRSVMGDDQMRGFHSDWRAPGEPTGNLGRLLALARSRSAATRMSRKSSTASSSTSSRTCDGISSSAVRVRVGVDPEDRQVIAVLVDEVRERRHAYRALAANRRDACRFVFLMIARTLRSC